MPEIVILAGPNGAGKSTLATRFVPRNAPFLNADEIARTLAPLPGQNRDIAAGRLLLEMLETAVKANISFAIETNLANRTLAARIPRWQEEGYHVSLVFVWLPSANLAVHRVAARVRSGGHPSRKPQYGVGIKLACAHFLKFISRWSTVGSFMITPAAEVRFSSSRGGFVDRKYGALSKRN